MSDFESYSEMKYLFNLLFSAAYEVNANLQDMDGDGLDNGLVDAMEDLEYVLWKVEQFNGKG